MKEIHPAFISGVKTLQNVWNDQVDGFPAPSDVEKGHFSSNGEFVWIYRASHLIVTQIAGPAHPILAAGRTSPKYTLSRVNFAEVFSDASLKIQTVIELRDHLSFCDPSHNPYLLLVVLNRDSGSSTSAPQASVFSPGSSYQPPVSGNGSIIVTYDARLGKVVKAVECQFKVTAVEVISVSDSGRRETIVNNLPAELQYFHGVIVLGSVSGLVVFMDLCLDQISNESFVGDILNSSINSSFTGGLISGGNTNQIVPGIQVAKLTYAVRINSSSSTNYDMHSKRVTALTHGQHIGLPLNSDCITKCNFNYKSCVTDNPIEAVFESSSVYVNCLKYLPSTNSICIAYSFGGFHIYNLSSYYSLDCSCTVNRDTSNSLLPVVAFSPLEPENDPKNLTYLWLIRGSDSSVDNGYGYASAHLYCFGFQNKEWIPDYGNLYTGHESSNVLIDFVMTADPFNADLNDSADDLSMSGMSTFISCQTLELGNKWAIKASDGDDVLIDKSLFVFSWEVTPADNGSLSSNPRTFFAIFDLNQYYNAQLPRKWFLKSTNDVSSSLCQYLGIFSLDQIKESLPNEDILDFRLDESSYQKYRSTMYLHDLYFYPVSSSFDIKVLSERSIINATYHGLQKSTLNTIRTSGPDTLIDPKESLKNCFNSGLLPDDNFMTLPLAKQRETLLNVMLHNDELPYLATVIRSWSTDRDTHIGIDTKSALEWIVGQVSLIKGCIDKISEPLFIDSNAHFDDEYANKTLYPYEVDLTNLSYLLKTLRECIASHSHPNLLKVIDQRLEVISCISSYLRVMLWAVDCKLLPEREEGKGKSDDEICYPRSHLVAAYSLRRKKLKRLHADVLRGTEILTVDGLIEHLKDSIGKHLKNHSGSSLFPPTSIQVLIGIYLIPCVSADYKHMIMLYFLLEMAALIESDKHIESLEKIKLFPSAFNLDPSLTKFIQGIWGLDQEAFDFSYSSLSDPSVLKKYLVVNPTDSDSYKKFKENLYKRIVLSLVLQNQKSLAVKLASVARNLPSFQSVVDEYKLKSFVEKANQVRISYPRAHNVDQAENVYQTPRANGVRVAEGDVVLDPKLASEHPSADDSASNDADVTPEVVVLTSSRSSALPVSQSTPPKSCMKTPRKPPPADTDDADFEMEITMDETTVKRVQIIDDSERKMATPSPMKLPDSVVDDASDNMSTCTEDSKVSEVSKDGGEKTPTRRSKRQAKKKAQVDTPTFGMKLREKKNQE